MDRTETHDWLCRLRSDFYIYMGGRIPEEGIKSFKEALDYAISSLETDEAYNLMYEDPEFCENCIDRELFIRDLYCKAQGETSINIHWLEGYIKQFPSVLPKADNSILEDIKAEIENMLPNGGVVHKKTVIGIIDNYIADTDKKTKATTKDDLGVDCIDRAQAQTEIEMNASRYTIAKERGGMGQVEWSDQLIKVSDAVDIIRNMPSATPQEPKTGHISIDDVMSVFDDFMCGEVNEDGTELFLEMLKDKAKSEG